MSTIGVRFQSIDATHWHNRSTRFNPDSHKHGERPVSFYENRILPRIIDRICGHRAFADQRAKLIPQATGRVLEVGYGTGTSLQWGLCRIVAKNLDT